MKTLYVKKNRHFEYEVNKMFNIMRKEYLIMRKQDKKTSLNGILGIDFGTYRARCVKRLKVLNESLSLAFGKKIVCNSDISTFDVDLCIILEKPKCRVMLCMIDSNGPDPERSGDIDIDSIIIKPSKDWEPEIGVTLKEMVSTDSLTNMVVVDTNNYPLRYNSAEDILESWCERRLTIYEKRYDYQMGLFKRDLLRAKNKYIFVKAVVDKKLNLNQDDDKVEKDMLAMKLSKMGVEKKEVNFIDDDEQESDIKNEDNKSKKKDPSVPSFDYLLNMHMRSMTVKKLEELKKEIDAAKNKIEVLKDKTSKDLWREDLESLRIKSFCTIFIFGWLLNFVRVF